MNWENVENVLAQVWDTVWLSPGDGGQPQKTQKALASRPRSRNCQVHNRNAIHSTGKSLWMIQESGQINLSIIKMWFSLLIKITLRILREWNMTSAVEF